MVIAEKPCGPKISVTNLECIGYVQKRMVVKLRRLVKEKIGTRVHDGKTFFVAKYASLSLKYTNYKIIVL